MFEDATFHSRNIVHTRTSRWMLATFALNLGILAAMVAVPLFYPGSLPARELTRALYIPTPPPAAAPNHPHPTPAAIALHNPFANPFIAPPTIPKAAPEADPGPPAANPSLDNGLGSDSGVSGGSNIPALFFFQPPPPKVAPAPAKPRAISSGVAAGLLLHSVTPAYPAFAKMTGLSGTVVLAATISKTGGLENLHVLSGPAPLRQAAIEAVRQWRYRPYLLSNQPVEVETTINVVFSIGH